MIYFEWRNKPDEQRPDLQVVRVSYFARKLKWQFKEGCGDWDYEREPQVQDWEKLLSQARASYQRGKLAYKVVQLIESGLKAARRESKQIEDPLR